MGKDKKSNQKGAVMAKVKNFAVTAKSMWKTPLKGRYLALKEMCYFGLFALGNSWLMSAVNYVACISFIPYFYQIDTIHAYIIVAISSIVNMIFLPFIGNKIEQTKTKIGKYKPFIIGCIPFYVIFAMLAMWVPQLSQETSRILYAYLTCAPVLIMSTFCNNMYQNMPTVITPNAQERADIMTPIGLVVGFAPSLLQVVVGPIRSAFPDQEYLAMRIIGAVSVVISVACMLFILKVKERVYEVRTNDDEPQENKITFIESCKMLAKNKPLIIFCIALVLGSLRDFTGQFRWLIIQIRFNEDIATALQISGIPQTIIGFSATVAMLLLPIVTRKMDKKWIVVLFAVTSTLPNIILACIGYENIPIGTASLVVLTILYFISCVNPLYLLIPIMLGEIADYQQYLTGKRLDGHLQNFLFVVPGVATNLLMICSYFLQKAVGFEIKDYSLNSGSYTAAQQATACNWFNIVAIIAAVSGALLAIVMLFYPLSRKKHKEVVDDLMARGIITNVDAEQQDDNQNEDVADQRASTTDEAHLDADFNDVAGIDIVDDPT
ncbi:MAG: MFS transporter [Christensenellales bacterium]